MSAYSEAANGFVVSDRVTLMLDMLDDESRMRILNHAYKLARGMVTKPLLDSKEDNAAVVISTCATEIRQSFRKRQEQSRKARQVGAENISRLSHDGREIQQERKEEGSSPTPPSKEESKDNNNTPPKSPSKKSVAFIPPTVEEVAAYCAERKNSVDAQTFVDFYSAKGWMIGTNKMKDWRAAIRSTWERRMRHDSRLNGIRNVRPYGEGAKRTPTSGNFRSGTEDQRAEAASVL